MLFFCLTIRKRIHTILAVAVLAVLTASSCLAVPALPGDLNIQGHVGSQIAPPVLKRTGGPLVVSNSPETLTKHINGILYRAHIKAHHFRVFYHHQNLSGGDLLVGIAVTNPRGTRRSVELYVGHNSQFLPDKHENTANPDPVAAGKTALRNWFQSQKDDRWLYTLKPGRTAYILQPFPNGSTVTGMYDFGTKFLHSERPTPTLRVAVLACKAPPVKLGGIPILPPDTSGWHRRGTFLHCDRTGSIECDASNVSWLDLAGPIEGKYSRLLGNEMESGIGDPKALNPGNYGVVYYLHVIIRNNSSSDRRIRCLLNAAGGPGYSGIALNGTFKENPDVLQAWDSWSYKTTDIPSGDTAKFNIQFTLPGGSSGACRLFFWPGGAEIPHNSSPGA